MFSFLPALLPPWPTRRSDYRGNLLLMNALCLIPKGSEPAKAQEHVITCEMVAAGCLVS